MCPIRACHCTGLGFTDKNVSRLGVFIVLSLLLPYGQAMFERIEYEHPCDKQLIQVQATEVGLHEMFEKLCLCQWKDIEFTMGFLSRP